MHSDTRQKDDQTQESRPEVRSFFNEEAKGYASDVLSGSAGNDFINSMEVGVIQKLVQENRLPQGRYLDIGPGSGRICSILAPRCAHTTAVDISENMLENISKVLQSESLEKTTLVHSNFEEFAFGDQACFDLVTSFRVFKYFADIEAAIAKLGRLCAPGGVCVIQLPNSRSYQSLIIAAKAVFPVSGKSRRYLDSLSLVGINEAVAMFTCSGFLVEDIHYGLMLPYFLLARIDNPRLLDWLSRLDAWLRGTLLRRFCRDFIIVARRKNAG